jgi:hypothetical protein
VPFTITLVKGIVERFMNRRALHMYSTEKGYMNLPKPPIGPGSFRKKRGGTTEK